VGGGENPWRPQRGGGEYHCGMPGVGIQGKEGGIDGDGAVMGQKRKKNGVFPR